MKRINTYIIALLTISFLGSAQQTPAAQQQNTVAIVGATAHIGNGSVLKNSLIIFKDGVLQYVGANDEGKINSDTEVINASGQHVYPGFIIPNSTLGLIEIDAVRASDDDS